MCDILQDPSTVGRLASKRTSYTARICAIALTVSEWPACKSPRSKWQIRYMKRETLTDVSDVRQQRENLKPQKSFWRRGIQGGSRGYYVGVLPDGTRPWWGPAGPREDADVARKKAETRAERMQPKLRCVRVDERGGERGGAGRDREKSNDVARMRNELQGQGGARNRRKAELEFEVRNLISLLPKQNVFCSSPSLL